MQQNETSDESLVPHAVLDQLAFQIGRHIVGQTMAEYHAGKNGGEAERLRQQVEQLTIERDSAQAHVRTLQSRSDREDGASSEENGSET